MYASVDQCGICRAEIINGSFRIYVIDLGDIMIGFDACFTPGYVQEGEKIRKEGIISLGVDVIGVPKKGCQ